MLILTRKTGQGFTIGKDIEITINEVSGDKVRVGINAPKEIKILRSELTETMEQNVQAASKANASSLRALAAGLSAGLMKPAAAGSEKPAEKAPKESPKTPKSG